MNKRYGDDVGIYSTPTPVQKVEVIEHDWKLLFAALAVAVKDAKVSGDFSECEKIIDSAYKFLYLVIAKS